jgi:hypothetical protein
MIIFAAVKRHAAKSTPVIPRPVRRLVVGIRSFVLVRRDGAYQRERRYPQDHDESSSRNASALQVRILELGRDTDCHSPLRGFAMTGDGKFAPDRNGRGQMDE